MILPYALRGVRRHAGVLALLAATVAVSVALAALLVAAVASATAAFAARVPPVPLPARAVAFYPSRGPGYPAQELPTGLGWRLVVAGFPDSPPPGQVAAPAWLVAAAGLGPGAPVVVGGRTFTLAPAYEAAWDRALPLLVVAPGSLPLTGTLYAGGDPPPGAAWVLRADAGVAAARADLRAVYGPVDLLIAGVALLGGIGAADGFLLGLLRRRRQIGIARALGWQVGEVAGWLLAEAGLVAAVGALAGCGAALAAAAAFGLPRPNLPDALAAVGSVALALGLAAGRPAAWLRARTVADLLR
jgi:hypothetical protein